MGTDDTNFCPGTKASTLVLREELLRRAAAANTARPSQPANFRGRFLLYVAASLLGERRLRSKGVVMVKRAVGWVACRKYSLQGTAMRCDAMLWE